MAHFDETFASWRPEDFAAFEAAKQGSNRYNRERETLRMRLISGLSQVTALAGVETGSLRIWTTPTNPCVFNNRSVVELLCLWCRPLDLGEAMARAEKTMSASRLHVCHLTLGLRIDAEGVRIALALPAEAAFDQRSWRSGLSELLTLARSGEVELRLAGVAAASEELEAAVAAEAAVEWSLGLGATAGQALAGGLSLERMAAFVRSAWPAFQACLWRGELPVPAAVSPVQPPGAAPPEPDAVEAGRAGRAGSLPGSGGRPAPRSESRSPGPVRPDAEPQAASPGSRPGGSRPGLASDRRASGHVPRVEPGLGGAGASAARMSAAERWTSVARRLQGSPDEPAGTSPVEEAGGTRGQARDRPDRGRPADHSRDHGSRPTREPSPGRREGPDLQPHGRGEQRRDPEGPGSWRPRRPEERRPGGPPASRPGPGADSRREGPRRDDRARPQAAALSVPAGSSLVRPSPGQLVSGTRVVLTGGLLEGRIGTLIAIEADEAEVQIGLMTTRVPVSALRLPPR